MVGHSFVRRLDSKQRNGEMPANVYFLFIFLLRIKLFGNESGTLRYLAQSLVLSNTIDSLGPDVVVLQVDGNDIYIYERNRTVINGMLPHF